MPCATCRAASSEYLRLRAAALAAVPATSAGPAGPAGSTDAAAARAARKDLARIERRLGRLAEQTSALHAQMAQHATDHVRIAELDAQLRARAAETAALEEEWLTVVDAGDGDPD